MAGSGSMSGQSRLAPPSRYDEDNLLLEEETLVRILVKFGQLPCTIVQGLLPDFGATLKIHKNSNFGRNQLKVSMQHKYMYMYQKM